MRREIDRIGGKEAELTEDDRGNGVIRLQNGRYSNEWREVQQMHGHNGHMDGQREARRFRQESGTCIVPLLVG